MSRKFNPLRPWFAASLLIGCLGASAAAGSERILINHPPPHYPELAREMHISGIVVLSVTIQANGSVSASQIQSGHPLLGQAAQEAIMRWRFAPATEPSSQTVEVKFNLDSHQ